MSKHSIELKDGYVLWAFLREDDDGSKYLDLASGITSSKIDSYTGGLAPYDSQGNPLTIGLGVSYVYINDQRGMNLLKLDMNEMGEIVDVEHPVVTLVVRLDGGGSMGNASVVAGHLLFALRLK